MSERVAVAVEPERLQLPPGGRAEVTLTVTNLSHVVEQFVLHVEGVSRDWLTLREPSVNLFPGSQGRLALEVHLPNGGAVPAGTQRLVLEVLPRGAPEDPAAVVLPLEVLPVGGLEAEITPRLATGRRAGHYQVRLANRGNAEQVVDLAVVDPGHSIEAWLASDRVVVPPGAAAEVALAVRPRRRPLVSAPVQHPFSVVVREAGQPAALPLASPEAAFIYRGWVSAVSGPGAGARSLLIALGALLLAGALAVWFFGAPRSVPIVAPEPTFAPEPTPNAASPPAPSAASASSAPSTSSATPSVGRFELSRPPDAPRGELALRWEVHGAKQVTIDGQPQPPAGTLPVKAGDDHVYTLEARNDAGTVTRSLGVVLLRPPEITTFRASPETVARGQPVTLTWETRRADRVGLDQQAVDAKGSLQRRPDRDTTYTLVAENELGRVEQRAVVRVTEPAARP